MINKVYNDLFKQKIMDIYSLETAYPITVM